MDPMDLEVVNNTGSLHGNWLGKKGKIKKAQASYTYNRT